MRYYLNFTMYRFFNYQETLKKKETRIWLHNMTIHYRVFKYYETQQNKLS